MEGVAFRLVRASPSLIRAGVGRFPIGIFGRERGKPRRELGSRDARNRPSTPISDLARLA
jgi:hypothetical protein